MSDSDGPDWLLVPMEVSALVVGKDAGDYAWSDLAPDYSKIWGIPALIGPDLVSVFPQGTSGPAPGLGIHLHWLLPEAFGRGVGNEYPVIPNRWMVQRVRYAPNTCEVRDVARWMVESDFLHQSNDKTKAGAISILRPQRPYLFDSVGRATPLRDWTETKPEFDLTALGSGVPYFPSHYPACKSVLGFHDSKPAGGEPGDWQISYLVTGWCSDPSKDLLHGAIGKDLDAKLKTLEWSAPEADVPRRVLCHGAVCRVLWNAENPHISAAPRTRASVFLGNTIAEALGTLLAGRMRNGGDEAQQLEPLLSAFQYDMLGSLPQIDDVYAEFHRHRFTSSPGADRYSIEAKRKPVAPGAGVEPDAAEQPSFVQRLPADIESALYDLNAKAREDARLAGELGSLRQALFTTWCLWAKNYATQPFGTKTSITPEVVQRGKDAVAAAAKASQAAHGDHETARKALEDTLASRFADLELARSTEPPFYRATDPAILLAGKGLAPSGVADRYIRTESLPCRRAAEAVTGVSAEAPNTDTMVAVHANDLFGANTFLNALPAPASGPPGGLLDALLSEMLILDPADPRQAPLAPPVADLLAKALEGPLTLSDQAREELKKKIVELLTEPDAKAASPSFIGAETGVRARRPDAVSLFRWIGNPWRPILMAWEVKWHPDAGLEGDGDVAQAWKPWRLDDRGNEFQLPNPAPGAAPKPITYRSYAMLGPHPEWVLRRRLEKLRDQRSNGKTDEKLGAAISKIDSLDVLAQSLGGFHDALRQLRLGLQLPPINPEYVTKHFPPRSPLQNEVVDGVWNFADPQFMHAPDDHAGLQPIRAGQIEMGRLWLIDSFGQTAKPLDNDYDLFRSFGLPRPAQGAAPSLRIALPPRYVQPARLDLRWLSTDDDHPGGSPLCGWIFPNHLDQSLMICDAAGKLLGALQKIIRVKLAGGTGSTGGRNLKAFFWTPVPGSETTPSDIPDGHLRALVRKLLGIGADAGAGFVAAIAAAQKDRGASPEHDPRLSLLIGKPLALARASLRIELMGPPVRRVGAAIPNGAETGDPTRGFTRLRFPVRLGGPEGAAGGLAGYSLDDEDGVFYPRYGIAGGDYPGVLEHNRELSLDSERAVELTLLLDPAAPVHARCGLLPRHSFQLPAAAAAGVSSIRDVFFQSAPLVGPAGGPRVPRPSDDYGSWSWAVRPRVTYWQEYAEIADPGDRGGFGQTPTELQEGWLKLAMNPVSISAFWVKEGSVTVEPGTRVTLGWMVEGAETLTLSERQAEKPLETWSRRPGSSLPEEYRLQVTESMQVSLAATDRRGNRSVKSLQLNAKKGGSK